MGLKSLVVFGFLIASIALPLTQAQLGDILGPLLGPILGIFRIQGILYCTPDGNIGLNGTSTPIFPNAVVQLQCGGNVVSTTTTNGSGVFSMLLDPINMVPSRLLSGCMVAVNTPLASCNATLPSVGGLVSELQFLGSTLVGLLKVVNIIPSGFRFNANVN